MWIAVPHVTDRQQSDEYAEEDEVRDELVKQAGNELEESEEDRHFRTDD